MWKVERIVRKGDYNYAVVKDHPNSNMYGYVLHHRIVMENFLGRVLNPNEVVHHKNEDKLDNRIDNLEVLVVGEHERLHGLAKGRSMALMVCPECKTYFNRPKNQTHLSKGGKYTTCSKKCRGKFSRAIQLHGLTAEMESAISGNTVRVYQKYTTDNPEETIDNMGSVETIRIPPETVKR